MAKEKKEINYHAPVYEFDNKKTVVTNVGFTAGAVEKYQIAWLVPKTDEEAKERYDCTLNDLVAAGVRQFSTRPDYKTVGFDDDGNLKPEGHEAMQSLADGYKFGARASGGPTQKVMAQKAKSAESELDMSLEEMVAKMKELKEQGLV